MNLKDKIIDWKENPDAMGAEARVAVIIGELAAALEESIPDRVNAALKILSLRETMKDVSSELQHKIKSEHNVVNPTDPYGSFRVMSWTEALSVITIYLEESTMQIGSMAYLDGDEKIIQKPTEAEHAYHEGWQDYCSGKKISSYYNSSLLFLYYKDGWESAEKVDNL